MKNQNSGGDFRRQVQGLVCSARLLILSKLIFNEHLIQYLFLQSRTTEVSGVDTENEEEDGDPEKLANLMMEGTSRGVVKGNLLINYYKVGSNLVYAFIILVLFLLTQLLASGNDYFTRVL